MNYHVMSLDAIKLLCSVINKTVDLPTSVISDTSIATNTTHSSYKLKLDMDNLEATLKNYMDTAIAGLNKLTKEIINDKSLVVKDNVLYLYKADDDPSNDYMQMMLINGVAIELGSTQVDLSNIYNKTEIDDKFAVKIDLDTLTTSFNDLKDDFNTHISDTTIHITQDEKDSYALKNEVVNKTNIATSLDDTVTDEQVTSALLTKTELDKLSDSFVGIESALDDKADYKLVVENGSRYLEDIVTQEINNWLPNDNSTILINLKKLTGEKYANFQLICNKTDSQNWGCIVNGSNILWKINYANGVRTIQELVIVDNAKDVGVTTITPVNSAITGTIEYTVKNGICYVSLFDVKSTTNVEGLSISTTMPKPAINSGCSMFKGSTGVIGFAYINKDTTQLKANFYTTNILGSCSFSYPVAE